MVNFVKDKILIVEILMLILCFNSIKCYNILVIFGHFGRSHYDAFAPLLKELDRRGHNLTILSHFSIKDASTKNIREILFNNERTKLQVDLSLRGGSRLEAYRDPLFLAAHANEDCEIDLSTATFQNFLKENNSYDLILAEFFNTNCYYGLITKYKAQFIGLSSCLMLPWQWQWFGTPQNPSYNQVIFNGYNTTLSFLERVENTILNVFSHFWYKYAMETPGTALSKKYTGYEPAEPNDASLILMNTHHTLHGSRPLTPSVIEVGGIHVSNRKPEKLPKKLEDWIENSTSGIIYFSLGSLIKSTTFPEDKRIAFIRTFSKLPQRVIWKWENDTMPDKPSNVLIEKWMPQFDILCHPNTKVFITHGGLLGTTEALHCKVPTIVMPQFGDQRHNSKMIENSGLGVELLIHEATEETILAALNKVLDPKFRQNVADLSNRFKDRPMPPLETATYWIEHIARHKGAKHMRSPATKMPFYQYFLIDVLLFLGLILFIFIYIFYRLCKWVLENCFLSKEHTKSKTL